MATAKKLINLSLAALVIIALGNIPLASAHVLKQDHGISGVLHIPPEDSPSAAVPVTLNVSFADVKNSFSLANCDCQIVVQLNGNVIQAAPLRPYFSGSTLSSTSSVEFPKPGVYTVIARGSAQDDSFPKFQLQYLVRVTAGADSPATLSNKGSSVIIIAVGSLAILALFASIAIAGGSRYKQKPQKR